MATFRDLVSQNDACLIALTVLGKIIVLMSSGPLKTFLISQLYSTPEAVILGSKPCDCWFLTYMIQLLWTVFYSSRSLTFAVLCTNLIST